MLPYDDIDGAITEIIRITVLVVLLRVSIMLNG